MSEKEKEEIKGWVGIFISVFIAIFIIILLLAWMVFLMNIFISPQFNN